MGRTYTLQARRGSVTVAERCIHYKRQTMVCICDAPDIVSTVFNDFLASSVRVSRLGTDTGFTKLAVANKGPIRW